MLRCSVACSGNAESGWTMRTQAVVFAEPGRVEIREMETPDPGPHQIGIRTVYSGVSQGTERWSLTGRYGHYDHDYSRYYPCSPGYQAAGVVDVVGSAVDGFQVGDHAFTMGTHFTDPDYPYPGPNQASHSGYLVVDADQAWKVSPSVDLAGVSLFHMAGVSRHGVRLTKIQPGDLVVVLGLGMIGQMSAQAARRVGARVIASDLIPIRVELAAAHSADRAVNIDEEDLQDVLRAEAPQGADVVIDTTGISSIFGECLELVKHEGRIAMQGYYPDPIEIDFHPTHLQRPTVTFPCGWDDQFNDDLAQDMADGGIAIDPLITHRFSAADAVAAYEMVVNRPQESLGMVFNWEDM